MAAGANCVICDVPARVWCSADNAYLCAECDHKVHSSNAVAARHTRLPICELCKGAASDVYCCADKAYLCDLCSTAVHSDNPLAARHTIVPATQALAGSPEAAEESDAHSECPKQDAAPKAKAMEEAVCESAVFGGSEAVVPVLDLLPTGSEGAVPAADAPAAEAGASGEVLKAPWGKDTFDFLDMDNGWLDMGLDFSDILAEEPVPSEGLVPTFEAPAAEDANDDGAVPDLDLDLMGEPAKSLSLSGSLSLDLSVPSFPVPFSGPPTAETEAVQQQTVGAPHSQLPQAGPGPATAMLMQQQQQPVFELPSQVPYYQPQPAGSVWQTVYPAIQASPFYPNPAAFPVVSKDQAALNREQRVNRYREKRKTRKFEKTIRYASRKAYAEVRPRIKGRFARKDEIEAWARSEDAVVPQA